jgi:ribosome-associated heat shock protein Hsp15
MESARVDRWLCAVRLHATRSDAVDACAGGHVKINDKPAKPSSIVRVDDMVRTYSGQRERIVQVVRVIDKRVGATIASECIVDHSPAVATTDFVPPPFVRERGAGRPTKKDRRALDNLRR